MQHILVIDNYDSFTYNLVHYLEDLNCRVTVMQNDRITLGDVASFSKILLSPGPGIPDEAGLLKSVIRNYAATKSILGVCLGQQAIAEVFGGKIINLKTVYHGVATTIHLLEDDVLFRGLPQTFQAGRYHSWGVDANLPEDLIATSVDDNGQIMSLRHKKHKVWGVQYHPESILTPHGKKILENWLHA